MRAIIPLSCLLLAVGCGDRSPMDDAISAQTVAAGRGPGAKVAVAKLEAAKEDANEPAQRKLIFNGQLALVSADYEKARDALTALIEQAGGYAVNSEEQTTPGAPRRLTLTVRVPSPRSQEFRQQAAKTGEVLRSTLEAEDVTDQYYDVKAELENREAREAALREMYRSQQATAKLSELLEIDREIERVRGEINVRKGRVARWDKLTAFATFTITLEERTGYTLSESPTFATRVARSFLDSVSALVQIAQLLVMCAAAATPFVAVLTLVAAPLYLLSRRAKPNPPPGAGSAVQ